MHDINIGTTIMRERRAKEITQGELAGHLGVTKAAVSKWELGQSLPDVTLLPRIAAFFGLSLDELFDYRPQLSKEEVEELYCELMELLMEDAEVACVRADELEADYYTCWPLLVQLGTVYMGAVLRLPERSDELTQKAMMLFERVEYQSGDVELVQPMRFMRAMLLSQQGGIDEAIALVESIKPEKPFLAETVLGTLYQQKDDHETSLALYQGMLFWSVSAAMNSLSTQLQLPVDYDNDRLDALLNAGEGIIHGFDSERYSPSEALGFYSGAATACLKSGDDDRALLYLERFVDLLDATGRESFMEESRSILYDRVPELVVSEPSKSRMAQVQFDLFDLKNQYKQFVFGDEIWADRVDDARFKPLLERLSKL